MSRPAHIAALDAALDQALTRLGAAEAVVPAVLDKHLNALEEVDQAIAARSDAYYSAKHCEDAIRKLGYVVLGEGGRGAVARDGSRLKGRSFSLYEDRQAAKKRASQDASEGVRDE